MGEKAKNLPGGGELVFLPWQPSLGTLLEQLLMRLEEAGLSSWGHTLICLSGTPSLPCPLTPTTKPKMAHSLAKVAVAMKLRLPRMASSSGGQGAHPIQPRDAEVSVWGEEPHTLDPLTTWTRLITLCSESPLHLAPEAPHTCRPPTPWLRIRDPIKALLLLSSLSWRSSPCTCRLSPPSPSEHVSYGPGLTAFPPATGPLHLPPPLPETLSLRRAPSLDPSRPAVSPPRAP